MSVSISTISHQDDQSRRQIAEHKRYLKRRAVPLNECSIGAYRAPVECMNTANDEAYDFRVDLSIIRGVRASLYPREYHYKLRQSIIWILTAMINRLQHDIHPADS